MGRLLLAAAAVALLWYAYVEYSGPGGFRLSGSPSGGGAVGGFQGATKSVAGAVKGAASNIGN